jgi:hypothetical protein
MMSKVPKTSNSKILLKNHRLVLFFLKVSDCKIPNKSFASFAKMNDTVKMVSAGLGDL